MPRTTHVLAVGISNYGIATELRLPKAAERAAQFVEWACYDAEVPPDRIHCFLSSEDHEAYAERLALCDVTPQAATANHLETFIDEKLKALSGSLLYVLWVGHGSFVDDQERVLFFEDMKLDNPRYLNLTHLMVRLRAAPYGAKFPRQIVYVDACANPFDDLGFAQSAGVNKPGTGHRVSGVKQSFFMAAASGQQAVQGHFSEWVLAALKHQLAQHSVWPPDPGAIISHVLPHCEKSGQHPDLLEWEEDGRRKTVSAVGETEANQWYIDPVAKPWPWLARIDGCVPHTNQQDLFSPQLGTGFFVSLSVPEENGNAFRQ